MQAPNYQSTKPPPLPAKAASLEPPALTHGGGPAATEREPNEKDLNFDNVQGRTNDNPTGRQEPAVSLEWIGPPTIKLGQAVTFQIIVKNVSSIPVQQVIVRNRIPAGVTVQQTEPKAFSDVNMLTWDLGTLEPRQERRIDLRLLPERLRAMGCLT